MINLDYTTGTSSPLAQDTGFDVPLPVDNGGQDQVSTQHSLINVSHPESIDKFGQVTKFLPEAQAAQLLCSVVDHVSSLESRCDEAQAMHLDSSLQACMVSIMEAGWSKGCGALALCLRYVKTCSALST
jgi:hypothetical protein